MRSMDSGLSAATTSTMPRINILTINILLNINLILISNQECVITELTYSDSSLRKKRLMVSEK